MLDFEQQANQAQALASLDEDWHLLEGERTTFAIFSLSLYRVFEYTTVALTLDRWTPGETCSTLFTFSLPRVARDNLQTGYYSRLIEPDAKRYYLDIFARTGRFFSRTAVF
ncbi:hypothetical protein ANTPLA_LOCUS8539 [Anthophora plagiata]